MLNFTIRFDVRVIAVWMLDIPVEVERVRGVMRLPLVAVRIHVTILFAARRLPEPVGTGRSVGVFAAPRQFVPRMLGRPVGTGLPAAIPPSRHALPQPA
jgi:hypothetical protein